MYPWPTGPYTEREMQIASGWWKQKYYADHLSTERSMVGFFPIQSKSPWLADIRKASFLSISQMAERLKISKTIYARLERAEAEGRITLANLRRCAEALDCELVYGLRTKNGLPISERITWPLLHEINIESAMGLVPVPGIGALRLSALVGRMYRLMFDPWFRRARGWCPSPDFTGREVERTLNTIRRPTRRA